MIHLLVFFFVFIENGVWRWVIWRGENEIGDGVLGVIDRVEHWEEPDDGGGEFEDTEAVWGEPGMPDGRLGAFDS